MKRREAERAEHEQWRAVCAELLARRAVTQADLNSPVGKVETAGQYLLQLIRVWGDRRAALGVRDE